MAVRELMGGAGKRRNVTASCRWEEMNTVGHGMIHHYFVRLLILLDCNYYRRTIKLYLASGIYLMRKY